jgi:hypothetical protein
MRLRFLVALLALSSPLLPGAPRAGGENVWSGLVVATNVTNPKPPPPPMHRLTRTLEHTFGYNQFELIGQSRKTLESGEENWLAASKHFSLHVDAQGAMPDGYRLKLELFQDREILLEDGCDLEQKQSARHQGPQIGSGQLLLLLVVQ